MRLHLAIIVSVLLCGCSSMPPVIDLSESVYKVSSASGSERKQIGTLKIINMANDGKFTPLTLSGSPTNIPITPATRTKETVEQDLKRFFESTLSIDKTAAQDLTVTISRADSYWVWGGARRNIIVGVSEVFDAREFGVNLRVLFEIEQKGKVTASYLVDENIAIQDKAATQEDIIQSYQRLIADYRRRFFGELETRFIDRYF